MNTGTLSAANSPAAVQSSAAVEEWPVAALLEYWERVAGLTYEQHAALNAELEAKYGLTPSSGKKGTTTVKVNPMRSRRDGNEPEIIEALRAVGCSVVQLSMRDVPDLLVGFVHPEGGRMVNLLMEVKAGRNVLSAGQETFFETWPGPAVVVYSVEEALKAVGR